MRILAWFSYVWCSLFHTGGKTEYNDELDAWVCSRCKRVVSLQREQS